MGIAGFKSFVLSCSLILVAGSLAAFMRVDEVETTQYKPVMGMQDRAKLQDAWLAERLETVVPALMREAGVDMWVMIAREYNEDPVVKTMLPATWLSARRRTILIFFDNGETVERLAVSRYAVGDFFKAAWKPEDEPDQWARLNQIITARDPANIAVNVSSDFALADGMSHSQYSEFIAAVGPDYMKRVVPDHRLAVGWLETRIPAEMAHYGDIVAHAHAIIAEGFSNKVIIPGKTTTADVMWWYRDKIRARGFTTWFHPTVSIQRQINGARNQKMTELFDPNKDSVIRRGDLIHVDFGIKYLGLNTDTQHHGYILKVDEEDAPNGLKLALKAGNRLQDVLTSNYKAGLSGNTVLKATRDEAVKHGMMPSIYTHPIGYHGHAAGATIGLWDSQDGVPGKGEYPIRPNTAWSIELSTMVRIPEWGGQEVRIMLEEDAFFDGETVRYINGRQTGFHIIE